MNLFNIVDLKGCVCSVCIYKQTKSVFLALFSLGFIWKEPMSTYNPQK